MHPAPINFGRLTLRFDGEPHIMGILNCTPDSFSDGGEHLKPEIAIAAGLRMVEEGAAILDIGGESTRPGATPVSANDEVARVVPVIKGLRRHTQALISIDTTKASVAEAALLAGADIVNDVSGASMDPEMLPLLARTQAVAVLMHMRGTPRTMQRDTHYEDVVDSVASAIDALIERAVAAGVEPQRIIVDPGIGFGKNVLGNLRLIKHTRRFGQGRHAVLMGPSRKSFIGRILDQPDPAQRAWGTAGAVAASVSAGAHILRVHDVRPMREVTQVAYAIAQAP